MMTTTPNIDMYTQGVNAYLYKQQQQIVADFRHKTSLFATAAVTNKFMNNRQLLAKTLFYA